MMKFDYTKDYSEAELIKFAEKRVKIKRDLFSHITAYVVVNAFLIFIYFVDRDPKDTGTPWFVWVLAGWGVGLLIDIFDTIQSLKLTYNTTAVNKELEKIKRSLDR